VKVGEFACIYIIRFRKAVGESEEDRVGIGASAQSMATLYLEICGDDASGPLTGTLTQLS
jgi:hypothetical protein